MVTHILTMLLQYLNSNETLKLDDSFTLYLSILSVAHENFKKTSRKRSTKRTALTYQIKKKKLVVGRYKNLQRLHWAIDFPPDYFKSKSPNIFFNKCLLLCIIAGLLQHSYYDNRSKNKTFLYIQNIQNKNSKKQTTAGNLLAKELLKFFNTTGIHHEGPYDLLEVSKLVSKIYNCQLFVFTGLASNKKIRFMYPHEWDDTLMPIYMYEDFKNPNHLIFIKNLNSFFRANYKICFACKKSFSSINYFHLCKQRPSCFVCRRVYQNEKTFCNSYTKDMFCDSLLSLKNPRTCSVCNLTILTDHCGNGHKKICNGKGHFGWSCKDCKHFFIDMENKPLLISSRVINAQM